MKENVGKKDQLIRSFIGPGLMVLGYFFLNGKNGNLGGLTSIVAGTLITESAITKVCPVNEFFGIDTRKKKKSPVKRIKEALI
ncbi:YgaP family membrane protein [Salinimicrobium soli]|uniref:YgaP family membrane protein n=1 Tax=Salinimicrobium soli TaxID=1254399 RepID=UPI003AAB9D0E